MKGRGGRAERGRPAWHCVNNGVRATRTHARHGKGELGVPGRLLRGGSGEEGFGAGRAADGAHMARRPFPMRTSPSFEFLSKCRVLLAPSNVKCARARARYCEAARQPEVNPAEARARISPLLFTETATPRKNSSHPRRGFLANRKAPPPLGERFFRSCALSTFSRGIVITQPVHEPPLARDILHE